MSYYYDFFFYSNIYTSLYTAIIQYTTISIYFILYAYKIIYMIEILY